MLDRPQKTLLPCPFCGCAKINKARTVDEYLKVGFILSCEDCEITTPEYGDEISLSKAWNNRTGQ